MAMLLRTYHEQMICKQGVLSVFDELARLPLLVLLLP
jgi:hypothetical protein